MRKKILIIGLVMFALGYVCGIVVDPTTMTAVQVWTLAGLALILQIFGVIIAIIGGILKKKTAKP